LVRDTFLLAGAKGLYFMKHFSVIFFILFLTNLSFAKMDLPELEAKMWNYILHQQVDDNHVVRTEGGWPTYSRFRYSNIQSRESNSFVTSQLLVALGPFGKKYHFLNFEGVANRANLFLKKYVEDARKTAEPEGTIAYWPLLQTSSGKWIRSFSTKFPYNRLKTFNVPNDLDASANYFMWVHLNREDESYLHSFVKAVGDYLDKDREVLHPNDKRWKSAHSGAFLTWVDDDKVINPKTRIYKGINDVDCVVNLNILTALLTYKNSYGEIPLKSEFGLKASCKLMNETIFSRNAGICGVWYDRPSQFYTAYSKAYEAQGDFSCLEDSVEAAREDILKRAKDTLKIMGKGRYTEIAEYISVIKKLISPSDRTPSESQLLLKLEKKLKEGIISQGEVAFVKSTDSLFMTSLGLITVDWYSQEFSTAIALEALLLD